MILALAVILGLAIATVRYRGRTASQLADITLYWGWLAVVAMALQLPILRTPFGPPQQIAIQRLLFLLSHVLLLVFVWLNRHLVGIQIIGLGVLCNLFVIMLNGGLMPISPETLVQINPGTPLDLWTLGYHYGYSKDVILMRADTHLWVLSDILAVPPPFPWPVAFSAGDLIIAAGIVVLLQGPHLAHSSDPEALVQ